jgi:hypothetical protein
MAKMTYFPEGVLHPSVKADFQSSHEAPRSSLRVHAWALSSNHNAKQFILIRCKHSQSFVRGLEIRLKRSISTRQKFPWTENFPKNSTENLCRPITFYKIFFLQKIFLRPNKKKSWFQVSQPCFIWVGRSEKHFIKKNILSQVCNKYKLKLIINS